MRKNNNINILQFSKTFQIIVNVVVLKLQLKSYLVLSRLLSSPCGVHLRAAIDVETLKKKGKRKKERKKLVRSFYIFLYRASSF